MKITLNRINDDYLFECTNSVGNSILLDNLSASENSKGISPMESLLMAVAGCSGIDMVSILKKQRQEITDFKAEVEGERVQVDEAKPFKTIMVKFFVEGNINPKKAERAAALSFEKYCSVSKTLEPNVAVNYEVYVNGEKIEK
jgi:putative redox protein